MFWSSSTQKNLTFIDIPLCRTIILCGLMVSTLVRGGAVSLALAAQTAGVFSILGRLPPSSKVHHTAPSWPDIQQLRLLFRVEM